MFNMTDLERAQQNQTFYTATLDGVTYNDSIGIQDTSYGTDGYNTSSDGVGCLKYIGTSNTAESYILWKDQSTVTVIADPLDANSTVVDFCDSDDGCPSSLPTWDCDVVSGTCSDPGDGSGAFIDQATCNSGCGQIAGYNCNGYNDCVQVPYGGIADFATLALCQSSECYTGVSATNSYQKITAQTPSSWFEGWASKGVSTADRYAQKNKISARFGADNTFNEGGINGAQPTSYDVSLDGTWEWYNRFNTIGSNITASYDNSVSATACNDASYWPTGASDPADKLPSYISTPITSVISYCWKHFRLGGAMVNIEVQDIAALGAGSGLMGGSGNKFLVQDPNYAPSGFIAGLNYITNSATPGGPTYPAYDGLVQLGIPVRRIWQSKVLNKSWLETNHPTFWGTGTNASTEHVGKPMRHWRAAGNYLTKPGSGTQDPWLHYAGEDIWGNSWDDWVIGYNIGILPVGITAGGSDGEPFFMFPDDDGSYGQDITGIAANPTNLHQEPPYAIGSTTNQWIDRPYKYNYYTRNNSKWANAEANKWTDLQYVDHFYSVEVYDPLITGLAANYPAYIDLYMVMRLDPFPSSDILTNPANHFGGMLLSLIHI